MKKVVVLLVAVAVMMYTVPLFAEGTSSSQGKSLFQFFADAMKGTCDKVNEDAKTTSSHAREVVNTGAFQRTSDGIKEGSAKAKAESLRTSTK